MKVRKAIFPAAGKGTRFLPATKSLPKEMLPLIDKPLIHYGIEEALAAGIKSIIIITCRGKSAIEDYFDVSYELEMLLQERDKTDLLKRVREISELMEISYVRQKSPLGVGHAIYIARELVGEEPFAVLFADDIIQASVPCIKQLIKEAEKLKSPVLAIQQVRREETSKYGIIQGEKIADRLYRITDMVEKPSPEEAPSDLAIVGRYVLTPEIFPLLEKTLPDKSGEIQITDGLRLLAQQVPIYGYQFEGIRFDAGSKCGMLKAIVKLALEHPEVGEEFREYLKSLRF
ncbi:UTP--glucose-1-phosphate uridylyltransferase [bacterium (candidate division B38) B3_B38]|nr:MAG: UTP--glucose-1-phosphate uridylyltransferase [bacterium (candidate division B38) B3_B38]